MWNETLARLAPDSAATHAVRDWNAREGSVRLYYSGLNTVFRFEDRETGEGRFLKITHPTLRNRAGVEGASAFLHHVATHHAPVCVPITSTHGRFVENLPQAQTTDTFISVVTGEVVGVLVKDAIADCVDAPFHLVVFIGMALGAFHNTAASFAPPPEFTARFQALPELWAHVGGWISPNDAPAQAEYRKLNEWFAALPPPSPEEWGWTHGDAHIENLIWNAERKTVTLIDFDEPVYAPLACDLARVLMELIEKWPHCAAVLRHFLLRGYRRARPLSPQWDDALPYLLRMKELDLYAWNPEGEAGGRDEHGNYPAPADTPWRQNLRARFGQPLVWE